MELITSTVISTFSLLVIALFWSVCVCLRLCVVFIYFPPLHPPPAFLVKKAIRNGDKLTASLVYSPDKSRMVASKY